MRYLYIVCLIITFQINAQKQIERQIEASIIKNVAIDGTGIFKIKVNTHNAPEVKVKALVEGEHNAYIVLFTEAVDSTLTISTKWDSLFVQEDDKLSAHKVISIELEVLLPKAISLYAKSDIASAEIKGYYKQLIVELNNGNCNLETQAEHTKINTVEGNISVLTKKNACRGYFKEWKNRYRCNEWK